MKAANVERVVHAVADHLKERADAAKVPNEITALRHRVTSLETLLETLTDVMLEGTSADPNAKKK